MPTEHEYIMAAANALANDLGTLPSELMNVRVNAQVAVTVIATAMYNHFEGDTKGAGRTVDPDAPTSDLTKSATP